MKKSLSKILISCSAFLSMVMPISAETYAVTRTCPNCKTGVCEQRTTRTYEHDERFPCTHGTAKYDLYAVYEVKTYETCVDCGYYKVLSSYEDHVYKKCTN